MRSMTGFGSATREGPAGSVSCELRSFNHRQLKVSLRLPPSLSGWEADLEARLRASLARGSVFGTLRTGRPKASTSSLVDTALARQYASSLADLAAELGLPGEPDLALLASLPGVVVTSPVGEKADDALGETAEEALDAALAELAASRASEGKALRKDFEARLRRVSKGIAAVRRRAPRAAAEARDRLRARLEEVLEGRPAALGEAVAREVVLLADRGDVTEEVTRLDAHVAAFREAAGGEGEIGRRLDFLLQEMLREVNTIGSKSQDAVLSAAVVDMKVEVDRMKEQAANVE
ncbi:MAG: YicC family protein [Planctomycetes bacterium]|nr:YicC family protein [Planctomycetota bacterium]